MVLFLSILVLGIVAGIGFGGYVAYSFVKQIIAEAPEVDTLDATPTGYMSTVLDIKGNVTAQLVASGSNRVYVTIDEIPNNLQHAFVAIEDERFYEHNGIDVKGIIRAGLRGIMKGRFNEGASTITQQLLKNNVFDGWTTENERQRVERKFQEQYLAIQLERKVSKEWIMENYLNTINLGQNTLGVQSASRRYFGKDVSELELSECAAIAAITQNPSRYNPISHPKDNNTRRIKVLTNMKNLGYITREEYDQAVEDDIYSRISEVNTSIQKSEANVTSYFVDALTKEVIRDLQYELGYSEAQAYKALYSGGLTIYSTQDPKIQKICDREVNNQDNYESSKEISFSYAISIQQTDGSVEHFSEQSLLSYYRKKDSSYTLNYPSKDKAKAAIKKYKKYLLKKGGTVIGENVTYTIQPQTSVTIIDQRSGKVKALVGGRGEKTASKTLNRATDTKRQPGSTFKILSTYATVLDKEEYTLATTVKDEPISYSSGKTVRNADGRYRGYTSIREAIQNSVNVVAVKTIQEITPQSALEMVEKFGITTLTEDDAIEALALGAVSRGVTNLELTAAYAAIANGGTYREPILYTKIVDHEGNVILEKKSKKKRVIKKTTAFLLTSAMEDVVKKGTGIKAGFDGMSIAGKTGTTGTSSAARDAWFVGYTPYYTCAVWGGYDDNAELNYKNYPKYLWRSIMSEVHEGKEDTGFTKPEGVSRYSVCKTSGKLAISGVCPKVTSEYFVKGTQPTEQCDLHESAVICKKSGLLAGEYCPEDQKETKVFIKETDENDHRIPKKKEDGTYEEGEEPMPDKVCDVHTKKTILDKLKEQLGNKKKATKKKNATQENESPVPETN